MSQDPILLQHPELVGSISVTAKILGSLFYFPISHENNMDALSQIRQDVTQTDTGFGMLAAQAHQEDKEALALDFQQLFEGGDVMPAPPWGSVYLDREQVIFGDSTLKFREFLKRFGIDLQTGMREPEDQFGLILFVLATLSEQLQQPEHSAEVKLAFANGVTELLQDHLLPWAPSYLTQMRKHAQTKSYQMLPELAEHWLNYLQETLAITPTEMKIYFQSDK